MDESVEQFMEANGFEAVKNREGETMFYRSTTDNLDFERRQAAFIYRLVKQREVEARKAEHQSWSIVYGIGYDPDNTDLPKNIKTLRAKWSKDELDINSKLTQGDNDE